MEPGKFGTTWDTSVAVTTYVHPDYPDQIWIGAKGGLYVSTDGTATTPTFTKSGTKEPSEHFRARRPKPAPAALAPPAANSEIARSHLSFILPR